jgi:hypothetical protein
LEELAEKTKGTFKGKSDTVVQSPENAPADGGKHDEQEPDTGDDVEDAKPDDDDNNNNDDDNNNNDDDNDDDDDSDGGPPDPESAGNNPHNPISDIWASSDSVFMGLRVYSKGARASIVGQLRTTPITSRGVECA